MCVHGHLYIPRPLVSSLTQHTTVWLSFPQNCLTGQTSTRGSSSFLYSQSVSCFHKLHNHVTLIYKDTHKQTHTTSLNNLRFCSEQDLCNLLKTWNLFLSLTYAQNREKRYRYMGHKLQNITSTDTNSNVGFAKQFTIHETHTDKLN